MRTTPIWRNGHLMPFPTIPAGVCDHALDYASTVFDGTRFYDFADGQVRFFFRLFDHCRRALENARFFRMEVPYSVAALAQAHLDLHRQYPQADYFRLRISRGDPQLAEADRQLGRQPRSIGGVHPGLCSINVDIVPDVWGSYFPQGMSVMTSPWARPSPRSGVPTIKCAANYGIAHLARIIAKERGFDDALMLTEDGRVAELTGANLFVRHGKLIRTPPWSDGILPGITRATLLTWAEAYGVRIREESIPAAEIFTADEVLAVGTAAQVTSIAAIDGYSVDRAADDNLFEQFAKWFNDYFVAANQHEDLKLRDPYNYLTFVE